MTKRKKRHHIVYNDDDLKEKLADLKEKLGMNTNEELLNFFVSQTDDEILDKEWQGFKDIASRYISNDHRREFLSIMEAQFYIVIVNGDRISSEFNRQMMSKYGVI